MFEAAGWDTWGARIFRIGRISKYIQYDGHLDLEFQM